jgi:hypothetical protein
VAYLEESLQDLLLNKFDTVFVDTGREIDAICGYICK